MKHILLLGAGKSATVLIAYLKNIASSYRWQVTIADSDWVLVQSKVGEHPLVQARQLDILDEPARISVIQTADIIISMMPPALHYLVALDCLKFKKHLLTASYADDNIRQLSPDIRRSGISFFCEMGLDPGIDHMSAMYRLNRIRNLGGKIISFKSHCGGLVAPESDNNPWHYKISWNPRNVVLAGKAGAKFRDRLNTSNTQEFQKLPAAGSGFENSDVAIKRLEYEELFDNCSEVIIEGLGKLAYYPNRDSLSYISLYGLEKTETFIRTTLRYPVFCKGWKYVVAWKLTDEEKKYDTRNLTLAAFFKLHFEKEGFLKIVLAELESNVILREQFNYLGLNDSVTCINKGFCSAAGILQFILETKLALQPEDRDMIIMLHEIEYLFNDKKVKVNDLLILKGDDALHTAMAKAVGLPLGIGAKLILEGKIKEPGLHIPTISSIYEPVLKELKSYGIEFREYGNYSI